MIRAALCMLCIWFWHVGTCSNVDSLLQVLAVAREDTAKVRLLRTIAWKYSLIHADSSLLFYQQSLALASRLHHDEGQVMAYMGIALSLQRRDQKDSSLVIIQNAFRIAQKSGDFKHISMCYGALAHYYRDIVFVPDSSLHYYQLALRAAEKNGVVYDLWPLYMGRGELYYKMNMNAKGEMDLLKALEITEPKKIRKDYGVVLFRLIRNYFDLGDWDKYSDLSEKYLQFIAKGNPGRDRSSVAHRGLYFFEDDAQPQKVLPFLKKIADTHEKHHNIAGWIDALEYMSGLQWRSGLDQDAISNLEKAADLCHTYGYPQQEEVYYQRLSEMYAKRNNTPKAFFYFKKYKAVQDSNEMLDMRNRVTELEVKYETARKEDELKQQKLELEKQKLTNRNFGLAAACLGILALTVTGFLWMKIRSNRMLSEKNAMIVEALKEKELMMNEIHHRVKNNLQVIASLLHLQSKYIDDPSAVAAIKEGHNRVNSMSIIHQNLYGWENLATMNVQQYLQQLINSLFQSYNIDRNRIQMVTHVDPIPMDIDIMIPLALIMNELISNSLKHAFPDHRKGQITIALKQEAEHLMLEVRDDGIGMNESSAGRHGGSFGMELIRAFAQKLKASVEILPHPGMTTRLIIPKMSK